MKQTIGMIFGMFLLLSTAAADPNDLLQRKKALAAQYDNLPKAVHTGPQTRLHPLTMSAEELQEEEATAVPFGQTINEDPSPQESNSSEEVQP